MDIRINSTTNFKSGMNAQILRMEKNIIPRHVENYFCNLPTRDWRSFYNIDFKDNKAMATASRLCADIFNNMRKLFDYRNADKPWGDSKDALERAVTKLRGWCIGEEPDGQ